jgi:hypothetical protein
MPRQSTTFDEPDTSLIDAEAQDTEQSPEEAAAQIKKDNEERVAILDGLAKSIEDKLKARVPLRARKENEWRKAESLYHAPLNNSDNDLPETPFESKPTASAVRILTSFASSVTRLSPTMSRCSSLVVRKRIGT